MKQIQIQCTFDPEKDSVELKDFLELLHNIYCSNIPEDSHEIETNTSDSEKDEKNLDFKDKVEELQNENEEYKLKISELEKQLREKKDEVDQYAKKEVESEIKLTEKDKKIESLNEEKTYLEKKLERYEPPVVDGNDRYFNLSGEWFDETGDENAPLICKIDREGNVSFSFNVEKGDHYCYSQDFSKLEKFCEILEPIMDGANHINIVEWGKGKFQNETLFITSKTKIKLIRI